ncbi:MAG: thioredoxin family protein, partial [Gemmatimonadaceae bacterium]
PRSGEWMRTMRVLIGLLEVGAAVKFASNADMVSHWGILTRDVVLVLWAVLAIAGAAYLARGAITARRGPRSLVAGVVPALLSLVLAGWLGSGINGRQLTQIEAFLPPVVEASVVAGPASSGSGTRWVINDHSAALATARESGQLVFLDFTGYTCTNCRWMEANVFTDPAVESELRQFVLSRLYTDGEGEIYERQQAFQEEAFGTVALPLYAVVEPTGKVRGTLSGLTRDPAVFAAFLQSARAAKVASR